MKRLIWIFFFSFFIGGICLNASTSNETLRWAADLSSGVPSAFRDSENVSELKGFDKEIIEAVAQKLGKTPILVENEWNGLIAGLDRNLYDVVINVMPITSEGKGKVNYSTPYYRSHYALAVHKDSEHIKSLDDCKGLIVATIRNSKAIKVLQAYPEIKTRIYIEDVSLFSELTNKHVDAILLDKPIVMYYGGINSDIKTIEKPIGQIEYGIVAGKTNSLLVKNINRALGDLIKEGKVREILERWNLWNGETAELFGDFSQTNVEPIEYYNFLSQHKAAEIGLLGKVKKYVGYLPMLGKGALLTIEISVMSMILAILIGFLLAIVRIYAPAPIAKLVQLYVEVIRGTPLLIQLYFIFYGLPSIGVSLEPFTAGVIALGLNYAAYEAEIYRAGILAVPHGQMEAARALGMSHWQGLRYIVIPQAFRVVLPPMTNDFISLLKDSSLVSVITIIDLTFAYGILANTHYNYFGIGILVAIIYLLLGLPFVQLARWAEKRLAVEKKRARA